MFRRRGNYILEDHFQDSLLALLKRFFVLEGSPGEDVVFCFGVSPRRCELECIEELDIDTVVLHNALNSLALDTDDALVVFLRNIPIQLCRKLFTQLLVALLNLFKMRCHDIDQEVVFRITLERNVAVCLFHDLVDLSALFTGNEFLQFISHLAANAHTIWVLIVKRDVASFEEEIE